jgi:hypothetical protein
MNFKIGDKVYFEANYQILLKGTGIITGPRSMGDGGYYADVIEFFSPEEGFMENIVITPSDVCVPIEIYKSPLFTALKE